MSENAKNNSCLHCSVFNTEYQYQEIFDEFGIELGLQSLLAKHFHFDVSPDPRKPQRLCEVCVNNLIRLFDIDELERKRDAAKKEEPIVIPEVQPVAEVLRPVPITPTRDPSARIRNAMVAAQQITPKPSGSPALAKSPSPEEPQTKSGARLTPNMADQEQINALIQNINLNNM